MGAYLSEPMTQKQSEDGEGNKLKFGACSMQGWRISQEDAHNCIASFDDNSSLFAVYDGHGGAEVAIYLSKHLPDTLKACISYKNGEFVKALEECYLTIDASIKTPEVLKEIQKLAKSTNKGDNDAEASVDYEEENVGQLYEEATMPLDKLVAKYSSASETDAPVEEEDPNCKPGSSRSISFVSAGASSSPGSSKAGGSGSSSSAAASSSSSSSASLKVNGDSAGSSSSAEPASVATSSEEVKTESNESSSNELIVEGKKIELVIPEDKQEKKKEIEKSIEVSTKDDAMEVIESSETALAVNGKSSTVIEDGIAENGDKSKKIEESSKKLSENGEEKADISDKTANGEGGDSSNTASTTNGESPATKSESTTPASAEQTPRRKKVHPVPMVIPEEAKQEKRNSSPRKSAQFANEAGFGCSDSEDSDEDDDGYNMGDRSDDSSDVDDEEEDLGDDSDEDDEDDYEDEDAEEDERFLSEMQEPGYDSGATAVVCFMKWEADKLSLWVANAGDSRCVICREGKAIDMSHDHKPELDVEAKRIVRAGGKVTEDGRVNGGLNLSRALGDHSYKQNKSLPPEEQMISPMPSVEHIVLTPATDKFMVLACDGIWNSMTSQEVIDFVGPRLEKKEPLSKICEELFDYCLAPDTRGDGTGCDNMTCIIVQLSDAPEIYSGSKRRLSPCEPDTNLETESSKKSRVEDVAVADEG